MIFSIQTKTLLESLLIIQKGLPIKTPLPLLNTIKFDVNPDHVILTTSNGDLAIQMLIEADINVKETGKVAIIGKTLIDIIRKIDSNSVEFALIDNNQVAIRGGKVEYKLKLYEVLDYPNIDFNMQENPIIIDSEILKSMISETQYATSDQDKRVILTGVNFTCNNNLLRVVATDSYRLAQKLIKLRNQADFNFVIPSKSLQELEKILEVVSDNIEIHASSNKVLFKFSNILFQTRLLEGKYPDTQRIIPQDFPVCIPFNRNELINAVERVSLLSPKDRNENYNIIRFVLRLDQILEISSANVSIGEATEEVIPCGTIKGETLKIAFSSKYLLEALKTFKSPEVLIKFSGETKPFVIEGQLDIDLVQLILPVRID